MTMPSALHSPWKGNGNAALKVKGGRALEAGGGEEGGGGDKGRGGLVMPWATSFGAVWCSTHGTLRSLTEEPPYQDQLPPQGPGGSNDPPLPSWSNVPTALDPSQVHMVL